MHLSIFILSCVCLVVIIIQPSSSVRSYSSYEPSFIQEVLLKTQPDSFSVRQLGMQPADLSVVFKLNSLDQLRFSRRISLEVVRSRAIVKFSQFNSEINRIWRYFRHQLQKTIEFSIIKDLFLVKIDVLYDILFLKVF